MDEQTKAEVIAIVGVKIDEAMAFATKKYGDTPTDALQLTPKKYVDDLASSLFFSKTGVVTSGVSSVFIAHGLGATPSVYGVSVTTYPYYGPTGDNYSWIITVDSTNIRLDKSPDGVISLGYSTFAKL